MAVTFPKPIYPLTQYDVFRRMPDLGFLDPSDVTFNQHKAKMLKYAGDKDGSEVWLDFFKHTDGLITMEWIAGVSAYHQYTGLMNIREGSLDTALSTNAVVEKAFDKGFYLGPGVGGKMALTVTKEGSPYIILKGTIVGSLVDYFLIADETKTISGTDVLQVVVGYQDVISVAISGMPKFKKNTFKPQGYFVAEDQESFTVDNVAVELDTVHDPDRLDDAAYTLRRWVNGTVVIYSGNGIVGYRKADATSMTYSCISYNNDLGDKMVTSSPQIDAPLILEQYQILTLPSGALDREEIRVAATFYTPDGKLVQDGNYSAHIIKYFGGLIFDVADYNTDPDQEIVILKSPNFGTGSTELNNINNIRRSVDARGAAGIKINYYLREPGEGLTWRPIMYVDRRKLNTELQNSVDLFVGSRTMKMFRNPTTLSSMRLAAELSSLYGIEFVPADIEETLVVPFLGYLTSFSVDLRIEEDA